MAKLEPIPTPVGSPDAIDAAGQSPFEWGSCYRQNATHPQLGGPIKGCAFHPVCPFPKDRPRNYGVYIETSDGAHTTNIVPCFGYMGAYEQRAKEQEASGEVVAIIAEEGDMVEQVVRLSADPINCNKNGNMQLVETVRQVKVPVFPAPGTEGSAIPPKDRDVREHARRMIALRRQSAIDKRLGVDTQTFSTETNEGALDEAAEEVVTPKRPVGRPRKYPLPENS